MYSLNHHVTFYSRQKQLDLCPHLYDCLTHFLEALQISFHVNVQPQQVQKIGWQHAPNQQTARVFDSVRATLDLHF